MKIQLKHNPQLRLSDAVYETLLDAILSGHMETGAVISEVSLAQQLEVSRTPVHDALRQLANDGLVIQEANRRAVVAKFTADDVYDIFDMRILLEAEAARRAATRMDRPARLELREAMEELSRDLTDPAWVARWTEFDDQFHSAIAVASGSRRLIQDISRYRTLHRSINRILTTLHVLQQALVEHRHILDALDARDPINAAAAMTEHIVEWQAYFVRQFKR